MSSTDENYWSGYDGLQSAKHNILKSYLGGWFPILASAKGKVLYIDCNAGRGRHTTGHEGSPILALKQLIDHNRLDQILSDTQVHFVFFEINQKNYDILQNEIKDLGDLPKGIFTHCYHSDYEKPLQQIVSDLESNGRKLTPSFLFIDPYGFSLSMDLLNKILSFPTTELLITFMLRYVDMAMTHEDQGDNLDLLFGTNAWWKIKGIANYEHRINEIILLFSRQLNAKYVSTMYMRSRQGTIKYVLFHATNHPKGRELMKECMWKTCPDGTFSASESTHPDQMVLLVSDPDLCPLEKLLLNDYHNCSVRVNDLYEWLRDTIFIKKHLHEVIRKLRNDGIVSTTEYEGRFAFNKNPLIIFP